MEKLYGIIGEKLGHTYSPEIHHKILESINIDGHFGVFQVERERLCHVIPGLKALDYKGITVTIPYKLEIIKYLDSLSEEAEKIGAVNVVKINNGKAIGYNTDYYGFGMTLEHYNIDFKGEDVVILGTGGASRAVVQYLFDNGAREIIFVTRNKKEGKKKYPQYKVINYEELGSIKEAALVVNCTPVGMYPKCDFTPIDKKYFKKFKAAVDIIYNPLETKFLKEAGEEGLKAVNGMYMLVAQAIKAQSIWNCMEVSYDIVNDIHKHMMSK
ncbi:shikimate dehydrogenase [Hathewaya histolytica]|uniref:shikimate dehydrogenase n=1 Tax=Hathewaya histolytica TaxID=1498 RepID=UPI003B677477